MIDASLPLLAGSASTVLFMASTLPMLVKAVRTKDLGSYSAGNLVLANVGNLVHAIYVFSLPPGPIWALHTFYLVTSFAMLAMWLGYRRRRCDGQRRNDGTQSLVSRFRTDVGATARKASRQMALSSAVLTPASSTPNQPRWPT
jgi:hypothetical protein